MKIFYYIFFIFLFISNCTLNKVIKHHGVHFLEKKQEQLVIGSSNSNDIIGLFGAPSTKGAFKDDIWIYIEITTSSSKYSLIGKKILVNNNVLILEIDNKGLLKKKSFLNKEDMNNLKFTESTTATDYTKNKFVYEFLNSVRQKINDPLGKKKIK
tara:strand:+ start:53 stop:517 length:465 start_codon:yes stop_codon:yes gene_type:complete